MTLPTQDELLALDWTYNGLPFAPVKAKSAVDTDSLQFRGEPFMPLGEGGGPPPEPPELIPVYVQLTTSAPPITATTFVRETGDVLLMEEGFTLIEEDETLSSGTPTIELFTTSTPTAGDWVLGRLWSTNAKTDGVLRSTSPSLAGDVQEATLTLVVAATSSISFDWGIRARWFGANNPESSDLLQFFIDDVEQMVKYPADVPGDLDLSTGSSSFVLLAGTYDLRWRFQRTAGTTWSPLEAHAWIANLLIDPTF